MGLATAWRAAAAGLNVVLIDQFEFGHVRGASHGSERIFRYGYTDPTYVKLALAAEDGWRQLEMDSGIPLLDRIGCVDHGTVDELEDMAAACQAEGVAIDWLEAEVAERRWPGLRFKSPVLVQPGGGPHPCRRRPGGDAGPGRGEGRRAALGRGGDPARPR